ncbi:MAG: hypothetical protein JNK58_02725 [Phycisphaerae bacterium]|nr:hypothetical protein [Phycisphaerae bacterium]
MSAPTLQLLCETCGYPIDGITASAACPECGRPIDESLPARRIGSPWQQCPGLRAWALTGWRLLRHPRAAWSAVRIERRQSASLLLANLIFSAALGTATLLPGPAWSAPIRYTLAFFTILFLLLLALSTVEYAGIRFLGKHHAFRITESVALTTCAHASYGWLLSGAGLAIAAQVLQRIGPFWNASMGFRGGRNTGVLLAGGIMLIAFVSGMIAYSILCGLGYRALRYANS